MTRKEQKEEKRNAILITALNLFVTRGYYETKITDIAEAVPMSTGLLFHYFESKESLLTELVKMGAAGTGSFKPEGDIDPEMFFKGVLAKLFEYSKTQPWVFNMFVLMGQARRPGMPEEARQIALSVSAVKSSAKLIKAGQAKGVFREGNPELLSQCFWSTVQGIMEEMAYNPKMKTPDPDWIVAVIKK